MIKFIIVATMISCTSGTYTTNVRSFPTISTPSQFVAGTGPITKQDIDIIAEYKVGK